MKSLKNNLFRISEYLKYYLRADTIYSIDSPLLTEFFRKVLDDRRWYYNFGLINALRSKLENDHTIITKSDIGAGSFSGNTNMTTISKIASTSGISSFKGQLLFRLVHWFKPNMILELGTNLGLSAAYLAGPDSRTKVITIEGDKNLIPIATSNIGFLKLNNIEIRNALFEDELSKQLKDNDFQLIYIDGNHTYEATIRYYKQCIENLKDQFLIVFDDIYWDPKMKASWLEIQKTTNCNFVLDLYHLGIIGNIDLIKYPIRKTLIPSRFKILKPGIFR